MPDMNDYHAFKSTTYFVRKMDNHIGCEKERGN